MKKMLLTLISISTLQISYAQLQLGLIVNEFAERLEVYAFHEDPLFTSEKTFLATGQVTLVVNTGNELENMTTVNGMWNMNSKATAPIENPTKDYISFGFDEYMKFPISGSKPVLLFTVEYTKDTDVKLVKNDDPFLKIPNSLNLNPGNELSMVNLDDGMGVLSYNSNYEPCGPSSLPCGFDEYYAEALKQKEFEEQTASQSDGTSIMASDIEKAGRQ